jgi:hypothetical protein
MKVYNSAKAKEHVGNILTKVTPSVSTLTMMVTLSLHTHSPLPLTDLLPPHHFRAACQVKECNEKTNFLKSHKLLTYKSEHSRTKLAYCVK